MLRLLAGTCVIYGSIGLSVKICQEMRFRLKLLEQMQEICRLCRMEIAYNRMPFPEICGLVAERIKEPLKGVMLEVYRQSIEKNGTQFAALWKAEMEKAVKQLPLQKEEKELFLEFGEQTGFSDYEMQTGAMQRLEMQLQKKTEELRSVMEKKEKVITGVGVLGGMMLVVIFL